MNLKACVPVPSVGCLLGVSCCVQHADLLAVVLILLLTNVLVAQVHRIYH